VAVMLLLTLRGTPTLYYGDEIGIGAVEIPPDRVADPRELREPGLGFGRDPVRTPMAWDSSPGGGFSSGEPWLPLHDDWPTRNVAAERTDPGSILSLHRELLRLRRRHVALALGDMAMIDADGPVLAYERHHADERMFVLLNLSGFPAQAVLPDGAIGRPILSTVHEIETAGDPCSAVTLRPDEGLILLAVTA